MNEVWKKLNLKEQNPILVINHPEEFEVNFGQFDSTIHTNIEGKYEFIIGFVKTNEELESIATDLINALSEEGLLWIAYPKGTSKLYKKVVNCNRNTIIESMGKYDFEGVRQVAIDEDWSALRFKPVNKIKTMTRKTAMSEKGRERINENL